MEKEKVEKLERWLESVEFYYLCQLYRHCSIESAGTFYEQLKDAIKQKVEEL